MAKLKTLPSEAVISGFKGVVDFYLWMGIPVARKWPRSPGHRRAPLVEEQWPAFSYVAKLWNTLPDYIQEPYRKLAAGSGLVGRDMFARAYLTGLYRYPTGP